MQRTIAALRTNNLRAELARSEAEARSLVETLVPEGSEVFTGTSQTLEALGIVELLDRSGRYRSVRAQLATMDRKSQEREMQKLGATPEYIVGSVHAVTEKGEIVVASATGSQLAPYAASASHVVWVAGTQKIVRDLEEALRRVQEYSYPLEDRRARKAYGVPSSISKLLIVNREPRPGRSSMVLVDKVLGF